MIGESRSQPARHAPTLSSPTERVMQTPVSSPENKKKVSSSRTPNSSKSSPCYSPKSHPGSPRIDDAKSSIRKMRMSMTRCREDLFGDDSSRQAAQDVREITENVHGILKEYHLRKNSQKKLFIDPPDLD
jgi:hypothetical protein